MTTITPHPSNTKPIRRLIIIAAGALLLFASCNKEENSNFTDTPIVEAYLLPGTDLTVKVSRQVPFSTSVTYSADEIDQIGIELNYGDNTVIMTPSGDGIYTAPGISMAEGDTFSLKFDFNEKTVKAFTYIPSKPDSMTQSVTKIYLSKIDSTSGFPGMGEMPEPVEISWSNPDNSYYLIIIENTSTDPEPIRELDDDEDRPAFVFRKAPTSNNRESLRPMEFEYFGLHRIILFHVLPDYAALYEQNSSSSLNLTNPSTSISNGYGIFTGLSSDTLYLEVKKN